MEDIQLSLTQELGRLLSTAAITILLTGVVMLIGRRLTSWYRQWRENRNEDKVRHRVEKYFRIRERLDDNKYVRNEQQ